MRSETACVGMLITLLVLSLIGTLASAETVVIKQTDRGWYNSNGSHSPGNTNYLVGDLSGATCSQACNSDYRNFFVFDLSGFSQPILSAQLALFVPVEGFRSLDPSENYELHDIVTPIATLRNGTGGLSAHTDLGSGVVYGSRTMTAADNGSVVEITLNSAAISALDAATGLIGIGGSITTLDGLANDELTFGGTVNGTEITELRIIVPEPSTLILFAISAFSLLGRRKIR